MCPLSCVTQPFFSSPSAFLCSEKQQKTLPSWMGLSLQHTKVLMNRGIVRERFVLTAHVCDPDVLHMCCLCPCHHYESPAWSLAGSLELYAVTYFFCGHMGKSLGEANVPVHHLVTVSLVFYDFPWQYCRSFLVFLDEQFHYVI